MDTYQRNLVLNYMIEHGSITSMEAFQLGITRLSAVIFVLRKSGYHIITTPAHSKNRYGKPTTFARYVLEGSTNE